MLTTMITQNAALQEEVKQNSGKSEALEQATRELGEFKSRVAKLTAEVDEMKQILQCIKLKARGAVVIRFIIID